MDKGLTTHYTFALNGVEHGREVFTGLCLHFNQPEAIRQYHPTEVDPARALYLLVRVTLGTLHSSAPNRKS